MNHTTEKAWRDLYGQEHLTVKIEKGLINIGKPGHTVEASKFTEVHEGRSTAAYYAVATTLGEMGSGQGLELLQALAELQNTDEQSYFSGCFRWYQEETKVKDTNAAFFILMPLVVQRLKLGNTIPHSHIPVMDNMMRLAAGWFSREIQNPTLYYPNKILSDGALLLGISRILGLENHYEEGKQFFERWLDYTERRGWGWGENISSLYTQIIMNALQIASLSLKKEDHALHARLQTVKSDLIHYVQFHDGHEYVPAIRSYNFDGLLHPDSLLWRIAGLERDDFIVVNSLGDAWIEISRLLFEDELELAIFVEQQVPRERIERIFDNSAAHTWIGATGRLGSVNRFPVIAGSYQHATWGLAWQSYPVSLAVEGQQVSFLRWHVQDGERIRTHPAKYKQIYLDPALFGETWYPDIQLRSAQQENAMLVVRSMSSVNNRTEEIADEWIVHRWTGELYNQPDSTGRSWTVLQYPDSAVLIAPLSGISYKDSSRQPAVLKSVMEGETLRLRQVLHQGELATITHPRMETAWAFYYLDGISELAAIKAVLAQISVEDDSFKDGEVPRNGYTEIRHICLSIDGKKFVDLQVDPHNMDAPVFVAM
jgi:hypothetical protein